MPQQGAAQVSSGLVVICFTAQSEIRISYCVSKHLRTSDMETGVTGANTISEDKQDEPGNKYDTINIRIKHK